MKTVVFGKITNSQKTSSEKSQRIWGKSKFYMFEITYFIRTTISKIIKPVPTVLAGHLLSQVDMVLNKTLGKVKSKFEIQKMQMRETIHKFLTETSDW